MYLCARACVHAQVQCKESMGKGKNQERGGEILGSR